MTNNKQQTAVDIIYQGMSDKIVMQDLNKTLICIHISHDDFLKLHKQAQAMHKQEIINSFFEGAYGGDNISGEQYYKETYGEGEQ